MNVIVIGASRGVGRRVVERALAEKHQVTAAVRDPVSVELNHPCLRVVACDVLDATRLAAVLPGHDAVLCAIGTDTRGPTTLYSTAVKNILLGMREHRMRRLVFLSNFGVLGEKAHDWRGAALLFLVRRIISHTLADHRRALDALRQSELDWVAVRAVPLSDEAWSGAYRITLDGLPPQFRSIPRADVADFMLRQIDSSSYLRKVPAIAR